MDSARDEAPAPGAATWSKALEFDELWEGDMVGVEVDDTAVLLLNIEGTVCAYEDRCPHKSSLLSNGDFDGESIVCATHLWEFDAGSGTGINPATAALQSFPVVVEDGMICVDLSGYVRRAPLEGPDDE